MMNLMNSQYTSGLEANKEIPREKLKNVSEQILKPYDNDKPKSQLDAEHMWIAYFYNTKKFSLKADEKYMKSQEEIEIVFRGTKERDFIENQGTEQKKRNMVKRNVKFVYLDENCYIKILTCRLMAGI
jgi:hypothetical protein